MEHWEGLLIISVSSLWAYGHWRWGDRYYNSWGDMVGRPFKPRTLQRMRWTGVATGCFFIVMTILVMTGVVTPSK